MRYTVRRPLRCTLVLACGIGMSACATDTADDRANGTSAGGRAVAPIMPAVARGADGVLRHTFPADVFDRTPRITMDSAPLATMGGAAGSREFDLTRAHQVALLSDGRLVTFAAVGARLLVFGADGREERVIGRLGKGPGEFMSPFGFVALPGDTLFLVDMANNRLNWVLPDGRFVRTPAIPWEHIDRLIAKPAAILPGGRVVLHSAGFVTGARSDTAFRSKAQVVAYGPSGDKRGIATVPDLAMQPVQRRTRGAIHRENDVVRFTPRAHIAPWDTLVATSSGERFAITVRDASGRVVRTLSIPTRRRAVTERMRTAALEAQLEMIATMQGEGGRDVLSKDELRQRAREQPYADSLPAIQDLLVGTDGMLWVVDRGGTDGADTTYLTAFRTDGALVGRLALPGERWPMAVGADRIVLRTTDEDDVVSLQVHRLRLPGR